MKRAIYRSSAQWLGRRSQPKPQQFICLFSRQPANQPLQPRTFRRTLADTSVAAREELDSYPPTPLAPKTSLEELPSPPPSSASRSAKLSALHARLGLPSRFPLETLARCLVDSSADSNPAFNNSSLSILGEDLLGYYTTEYVLCHYPRLPLAVIFAAQYAYVGPRALSVISREWGIEAAAAPGGEVDPGFLQFGRVAPGSQQTSAEEPLQVSRTGNLTEGENTEVGPGWRRREAEAKGWRRGLSSRVVYDNQFGDIQHAPEPQQEADSSVVTLQDASTKFVRALIGAIHLHCGRPAAKRFFTAHFLSRRLNYANLFDFHAPTVDLSRLCAREGFEPPVARLISETGRLSRTPVFVVGVYSGRDKLGEGVGASLNEARFKAAAAALKSWYLYSPMDVTLPSETEGVREGAKKWQPNIVDCGEVVS